MLWSWISSCLSERDFITADKVSRVEVEVQGLEETKSPHEAFHPSICIAAAAATPQAVSNDQGAYMLLNAGHSQDISLFLGGKNNLES